MRSDSSCGSDPQAEEQAGVQQHSPLVRTRYTQAENERLYEGKTGPHRAHYEKQAGAMMKREDCFHVEPSLMSNGPIITGECKQEKTLHTDTG